MNISEILSKWDEQKLQSKMMLEYAAGHAHVSSWREEVKDVASEYLVPKPKKNKIKIHLVRNKLRGRLAVFLSDEIDIQAVCNSGRLWKENARNFNKVAKAFYRTSNMRSKLRSAYTDDSLKWIWILAVDGWNDHSQEPILSYCDSRAAIPDPQNWQDNMMAFFGTELSKSLIELENDDAYDIERVQRTKNSVSQVLNDIKRADNKVKWFNITLFKSWMVDVYNHLTTFKAEWEETWLWLTTWTANRSTLVRAVKMRELTDEEKADPSQIDFGVKFFRSEPIDGSFAGATLIDDVWAHQIVETYLTNLSIDQAAKAAFGGKTIVDERLWIDIDQLANADPAGSVVSTWNVTDPNVTASNGIYQEQVTPVNQGTQAFIQYIKRLADENSSTSAITSGQSLPGDQTKAEIQTIQKNINTEFWYMADNYMETLLSLWESIYRSFAANMSSQRKKNIVIVDGWEPDAYGFKKNEFISKGEFYIVITSKARERIKKRQDFAVFFSIIWVMLQWLQPWSPRYNGLMRVLADKSGIDDFFGERFFPMSEDERRAHRNLELLNNDIKLDSKPIAWSDHNLIIDIYKTGLDTDARAEAIRAEELMLAATPKSTPTPQLWEPGQDTWWAARGLGASMLASEEAKWDGIVSLEQV